MDRKPVCLTAGLLLLGICFACCLVLSSGDALAQPGAGGMKAGEKMDADAKAEPDADDADAKKAAAPGAGAAKADGAKAAAADEPVKEKEVSPLAVEPKTPAELLEAALMMSDIARPALANAYLEKLLSQLDEPTLLELRDQFGAVAFVKLANNRALRPASVKLLELSNAAAAKRTNDPARVTKLIAQLTGTAEERAVALEELRATGPDVIPPLLKVLDDPTQAARHAVVLEGLVNMGEKAVPALIGALEAPDADLRVYAATALGALEASEAIPSLWFPATYANETAAVQMAARQALARILRVPQRDMGSMTAEGVVGRLTEIARSYYRNQHPIPTDNQGMATLWTWKPADETVVPGRFPPDVAADMLGTRFARQALTLAPDIRKIQLLYLGLALSAEARRAGWEHPLPAGPGTVHDLALSLGPQVVGDVLAEALSFGRPLTAVAALKVLEQTGTASQLKGYRPALVLALNYPDERVQNAAATTILQLDPQTPFPGASRVVAILNRALSSSSAPKAVIGHQSVERASLVGGLVSELGYEPLVVSSGRQAFVLAAERLDVELIVLNPGITRWALSETLANLRADSRTANIPIIIQGPADLRPRMEQHLKNYRKIVFAAESQVAKDLETQIRPFLQQVSSPPLSAPERASQKAAAVSWLAHLASGRRTKIFNITGSEEPLTIALQDPHLAGSALEAIGEIGSARTQQVLAAAVLDNGKDAAFRTAAAQKLVFHIQRFDLLLSKVTIAKLHGAWTAAEDPALSSALGSIIGSLNPDAPAVGKRLQGYQGK